MNIIGWAVRTFVKTTVKSAATVAVSAAIFFIGREMGRTEAQKGQ